MNRQTAKVKNGVITLPKSISKSWEKAEVFVFSEKDTLVVKKIQEAPDKLSKLASKISSPKLSANEIEKEIQVFRKNK